MQDWNNAGHTPNDDDDDLSFDWLDEEAEKGKPSSAGEGRTGVTGQLDWQHAGDESDEGTASDDDDMFDWQATSKNPAKPYQPDQTGLTGALDWQKAARPTDTGATEDEDTPDWQSAPPARAFGDTGQLMDWMANLDEDEPASSPAEVPDLVDDFDFDAGFPDETFGDTAEDDYASPSLPPASGGAGNDLPDWLADLDVPDASDEDVYAAQQSVLGSDDADWMTDGTPDATYDYEQQDEALDAQPDWMQDIPDFDTGADEGYAEADYADENTYDPNAAYYTDDAAQYTDEYAYGETDYQAEFALEDTGQGSDEYQATITPTTDDLFGDMFGEIESEPIAEDELALDDLLSETPVSAKTGSTDDLSLDDLLGEMTAGDDDLSLDDLLAEIETGDAPDSAPQPTFDADDFDFDSIPTLDTPQEEFDFDSLGLDEPEAAPVAQAEFDFEFDAAPTPQAADEFDFDSIIGLDEPDTAADAAADFGDFDFDATPEVVPADDDLAWLDAAHDTPEAVGISASTDEDDWLTADSADDFADFFSAEPDEAVPTGYEAMPDMAQQPTAANANLDWFGDEIAPTDTDAEPDWIDSLQDLDMDAVLAAEKPALRSEPKPPPKPPVEPEIDLDALLAESPIAARPPVSSFNTGDLNAFLDDEEPLEPIRSSALPGDLDALFGEHDDSLIDAAAASSEERMDVPDWLREVVSSANAETSATSLIRQHEDRPLDDLDDRLRSLRESGLNIKVDRTDTAVASLPGVKEALIPMPVKPVGETGQGAALRLTPDQQKRAQTLLRLVGIDTAGAVGRVELTEEGEIIPEAAPDTAKKARPQRQKRRWLVGLDQRIIAFILLAAVLVPFFVNINLGDAPPASFAPDSESAAAFALLDTAAPGSRVLIATEYGAAGAAELDELTRALLTHALLQGAQPVLVSTNPTGLLHGNTLISDIADEANRNTTYFVTGYLVGDSIGLRDMALNPALHFASDANGAPTGLSITSLNDFAVIALITDNTNSARAWMEQVVPLTRAPIIIATSYSAMPLVMPYARSLPNVAGLLIGYKDAYTYNSLLLADNPPAVIPTLLPTTEATEEAAPVVTQEATAEATAQPTTSGTALPPPIATVTLQPTATVTQVVMLEIVAVVGPSPINVRDDANTTARVAGQLQPGERVAIIGYSPARDWINVILSDGTEAWVAAFLVRVEQIPAGQFTGQLPRRAPGKSRPNEVIHAGIRVAQVAETPTALPDINATLVSPDAAPVISVQPIPQGEARWNAMTLGTLAAIVIILLGNLYYLVRGLLRRDN